MIIILLIASFELVAQHHTDTHKSTTDCHRYHCSYGH